MAKKDEQMSKGLVTYNKNILLSIVNLAEKEISGVASLCSNFGGSFFKKMFSNNYCEGVKLTHTKDGLVIDVYINIFADYNVADVAFRVQENIKSGITSMMNIPIHSINVRVMGVQFVSAEKK